jgi:hypothetical protein
MRKLVLTLILLQLLVTLPLWADKLKHEVDKNAPFSKFKTYAVKPGLVLLGDERERMDKATLETIKAQLNARGMIENNDHPDIFVDYMISLGADTAGRAAYAVGQKARYDFGVPSGLGGILNTTVLEGTLVIEVVDAASENLAWRASFTGIIRNPGKPDIQEKNLRGIVEKALKPYPPNSK